MFNLTKKHFCKRLTGYDKMNIILEQQKQDKQQNEGENKLIEAKISEVISYTQVFRSPIYLSTFLLIWENPLTVKYTYILLFSNYYLVMLTALEGAVLFSHGLVYYNIIRSSKKESIETMRERLRANRKRLIMLVTFFTGLVITVNLVNSGSLTQSLCTVFALNLYLYIKISFHITTKLVNSLTYMPRMKFIYTNMLMSMILVLVNYNKRKVVLNNLTY
jgi:hypothetical protein